MSLATVRSPAPVVASAAAVPGPRRGRLRSIVARPEWIVLALALAARLTVILRRGGSSGLFGYDAGVYFAGADSLVHGRLPYADYVQLHPPGITIALTPFALLTHVVSDSSAFTTAIVSFAGLGALNAVLVVRVCRRLGFGSRGSLVGGIFYAVWMGAVGAEFLIKLEPLGNALVLTALLLALRAERPRAARWASVLAGIPLGLAVSTKIWWIVPVLAIVCWHGARSRRGRAGVEMTAGAAAAAVVLNLPFFLAAPQQMWSMVVVDQVTRTRPAMTTITARLLDLSGLSYLNLAPVTTRVLLTAIGAVALGAAAGAWRVRAARPVVGLVAVQLVVVIASPSWFPYYCDYLAVATCIMVGAAAHGAFRRRIWVGLAGPLAMTVGAATVTTAILATAAVEVAPFRGAAALARSVASTRCVMSDSPAVQIRLNALSRGLAAGCPNWVDVTGPTYGPYRSATSRDRNPSWQRAFLAYLRRGQAIILVRGASSGESPAFRARIAGAEKLASAGGHTVYRTRP